MEKKNLDWKHIGFAYHTTDYRYVADIKMVNGRKDICRFSEYCSE